LRFENSYELKWHERTKDKKKKHNRYQKLN